MTSTIRIREVPRPEDDRVLEWLARRQKGETAAQIGASVGRSAGAVSAACLRVRDDDLAYSGEPAGIVRAGYW